MNAHRSIKKSEANWPVKKSIRVRKDKMASDIETVFPLDDDAYDEFLALLDEPAKDRPRLRKLLEDHPEWKDALLSGPFL